MDKYKQVGNVTKDNDRANMKLPNGDGENTAKKESDPTKQPEESTTSIEQDMIQRSPELHHNIPNVHYNNTITDYINLRNLKQFTFRDLEILCMEKVCKAMCNSSELEQIKPQIRKRKNKEKMWLDEKERLEQYIYDLKIRHLHLLYKAIQDRPLIPLKMTRSVEIQVGRTNNIVMNSITPAKPRRYMSFHITTVQNPIAPAKRNRIMAANRTAKAAKIMSTTKIKKTIETEIHVSTHKSEGQNCTAETAAPTISTANGVLD